MTTSFARRAVFALAAASFSALGAQAQTCDDVPAGIVCAMHDPSVLQPATPGIPVSALARVVTCIDVLSARVIALGLADDGTTLCGGESPGNQPTVLPGCNGELPPQAADLVACDGPFLFGFSCNALGREGKRLLARGSRRNSIIACASRRTSTSATDVRSYSIAYVFDDHGAIGCAADRDLKQSAGSEETFVFETDAGSARGRYTPTCRAIRDATQAADYATPRVR